MSKIIIHNESKQPDHIATARVMRVISQGKISGDNQYCWATSFFDIDVIAMKTRGNTHTFKVIDSEKMQSMQKEV